MSLTYATYVTTIANLMAVDENNDTGFTQILPSIIDYAELRCYRDLDLLATRVTDTATVTPNQRNFTLPSNNGKFVVVESINIFTPVGTTTTRNPVVATSLDFINFAWQTNTAASATTIPAYYAVLQQEADGDTVVTFGPPPGAAFTAEVIGTVRPTSLSVSNTTTFLSTYLPDLFVAASMIFATGYQKNFGAQSDDPKMAMSWETQYRTLLQGADAEEARKKGAGASWTAKRVEPTAVPQRG